MMIVIDRMLKILRNCGLVAHGTTSDEAIGAGGDPRWNSKFRGLLSIYVLLGSEYAYII